MNEKRYKVIKPYRADYFSPAILLPVGTILSWWEERGFYLSESVNGYRVPVRKWAVEAWRDYFEKVSEP